MKAATQFSRAVALAVLCGASLFAQDPAQPGLNAFRAEKNIEVGSFYLKKRNYDAAIERFQEAIRQRPGYARPYLLLGEAYEKKGEKIEAVNAYRKYLGILPTAEDAEKVRKSIQKLTRAIERDAGRRKPGP